MFVFHNTGEGRRGESGWGGTKIQFHTVLPAANWYHSGILTSIALRLHHNHSMHLSVSRPTLLIHPHLMFCSFFSLDNVHKLYVGLITAIGSPWKIWLVTVVVTEGKPVDYYIFGCAHSKLFPCIYCRTCTFCCVVGETLKTGWALLNKTKNERYPCLSVWSECLCREMLYLFYTWTVDRGCCCNAWLSLDIFSLSYKLWFMNCWFSSVQRPSTAVVPSGGREGQIEWPWKWRALVKRV